MKRVKILASIGILVAVVGLFGGLLKLGDVYTALVVYGLLLWLSIEVKILKENK